MEGVKRGCRCGLIFSSLVSVVKSWVSSERFLFLWLVGFGFQRLVLLSVHPAGAGGPFDQCDLMEEELACRVRKLYAEAAQSRASNKNG
jgi:hypothetical protein